MYDMTYIIEDEFWCSFKYKFDDKYRMLIMKKRLISELNGMKYITSIKNNGDGSYELVVIVNSLDIELVSKILEDVWLIVSYGGER